MIHRILIVTAVAAEADSVAAGLTTPPAGSAGPVVDVLVGGVGPAATAAATATALARAHAQDRPYDLIVSAGIAGGFLPHAPIGTVVVSDSIVAADLGAQSPDAPGGYLSVEELGFGRSAHPVPKPLVDRIAGALPGAVTGPVLTVSTVTGTAARAAELAARHPGAAAEAMEGFGVAEAAAAYGVPVVEVRAVSNAVGPRDRAAWRIGEALAALRDAVERLSRTVFVTALVTALVEPEEFPSCPS
ncbi:futalosine hydrolase [Streptomyces sp. SKN60]|uniref:futalosine hydrolase n=1 Tax=Streptomyces sp. SKN60 TaxID=2855506 RepID=UPI002247A293|nr:futalosine hydrolase [Streptomyces sp. SKN60]MCX2180864.1 futalosine hydrolase [Streptomyces sp. SKN60]